MSDMRSFLAYVNQYSDIARPNRFQVTFQTPDVLRSAYPDIGRKLALQCENAELPGRQLAVQDTRTYGPFRKQPYQTTYNDMSMTFFCTGNKVSGLLNTLNKFAGGAVSQGLRGLLGAGVASEIGTLATGVLRQIEGINNSNGMWERVFFDRWMDSINPMQSYSSSYNFSYPIDYTTNITVTHYDSSNNPTVAYQYVDAYPISIEHQSLNWSDDSLLLLTVTFAYTMWNYGQADSGGYLLNPISSLLNTVATNITGSRFAGQLISGLISTDPSGVSRDTISQGLNSILGRVR